MPCSLPSHLPGPSHPLLSPRGVFLLPAGETRSIPRHAAWPGKHSHFQIWGSAWVLLTTTTKPAAPTGSGHGGARWLSSSLQTGCLPGPGLGGEPWLPRPPAGGLGASQLSLALPPAARRHHARLAAVGGRPVRQGAHAVHGRPVLGAMQGRAAGIQAGQRHLTVLLGDRLRQPGLCVCVRQRRPHPPPRGGLREPGGHMCARVLRLPPWDPSLPAHSHPRFLHSQGVSGWSPPRKCVWPWPHKGGGSRQFPVTEDGGCTLGGPARSPWLVMQRDGASPMPAP